MKIPASLSYSVRRLGLFAVTLLFLTVVLPGASFLLVLVIATVVSGFLSYFLLATPRQQMAQSVEAKFKGLNRRIENSARAEDAALDAAEAAAQKERARKEAEQRAEQGKVKPGPGSTGNSRDSGEDAAAGA